MAPPEPCYITAIEPQPKRPERVSLFVDGEFALGLLGEVAAAAGLRVGQAVDVERLRHLAREEERRQAQECALRFLGYRARSRAEIRRRLERGGYEPEVIEEALDSLARSGLIDDAEFSESWVRARTGSRPMGPQRIALELRQKGVARDVIDDALQAVDPDRELDLALAVGRRKFEQMQGQAATPDGRRRLAAFLRRRGFSWEVCARVLDILLQPGD